MSYAICPYEWLQDKNIKNEVTLLMIIANLTNDKGFCWASNSYFAELLNETTVNISRKLKKLKEQNYIRLFHATDSRYGYNETDALSKCGGNTYKNKTEEEMKIIKEKISKSKIEGLNPMARKIKRINIE